MVLFIAIMMPLCAITLLHYTLLWWYVLVIAFIVLDMLIVMARARFSTVVEPKPFPMHQRPAGVSSILWKKNTRNSRNSHDESNKPAEVWKTHRNTIFAYVSPSPGWVPNTQFLAATRFSQGDINHGKSCAVSIFLNRLRPFVPYWKRQNLGFL